LSGIASVSMGLGNTYRLEYLYVAPEYRNQKIGSAVIGYICTLLKGMGGELVSASFFQDEDSEYIKTCLLNKHFVAKEEQVLWGAPVREVRNRMEEMNRRHMKVKGILPLEQVNKKQWDRCLKDYFESISAETTLTEILSQDEYDKKRSRVCLDIDGRCRGFILLSSVGEDITIDYLWSNDDNGIATMGLIMTALETIETEGRVLFEPKNAAARKLAKKILKDDCYYGTALTMVAEL
ncbi:MAG: GNAT family N-acetyltransferase, partial [Lachnospiraceae bacterium]|nr:GNAT family N-acetyltransferase [Lachnospiraceae bacterium]